MGTHEKCLSKYHVFYEKIRNVIPELTPNTPPNNSSVTELEVFTLRIETDSVDPDQISQNVASDQGLHYLPIIQQF